MSPTRREFVAISAAALTAGARHVSHSRPLAPSPGSRLAAPALDVAVAGTLLLFQGDSITDAGRDRSKSAANSPLALGAGYPLILTGLLRDRYPSRDLQVFNRGVSGNTVEDLRSRWAQDTIDLKPDVLSILIGVNDIWHTLAGQYNGTPEKYESGYRTLLDTTRAALPATRLIVLEPFVLRTGAVTDAWFPAFDRFRAGARRVAQDSRATFVPLHDMFQDLARKSSPAYWAADGVHPTLAGHAAIARRWLEVVKL